MKRLFVCYNPRASHHEAVSEEVLAAVRGLRGYMVGRYEIKPTSFDENAKAVASLLNDGDLVIVAGGDGSAAIVLNGILNSGKDVTVAVLGYGNFNDISGMLGVSRAKGVLEILARFEAGKTKEIYPLDITIDGKHWRYAPSYMTIGMFAQSTEVFEQPKVRKALQTGKKSRFYSLWQLAKWYCFGGGHKVRLPAGTLNGVAWKRGTTDYLAVNGATMAGMKGGKWYLDPHEFLSSTQRLGGLWRLFRFMMASMRKQVPGVVGDKDVLEFAEPSDIELHAEGEYEKLLGVSRIEVRKGKAKLKVIMGE